MERARDLIAAALADESLLRLVLSQPRCAAAECRKVVVRPVVVRGQTQWQFTSTRGPQVFHENLGREAAAGRISELLSSTFLQASVSTPAADHVCSLRDDGTENIKRKPPSQVAARHEHNRVKAYLIPENAPCPFLQAIGVMGPEGRVRGAKYHKFRQVNRFVELVADIVPALPRDRPLHVVDFGCGKSSLTFALHHLLTRMHGLDAHLVGLDRKADVLADCRRIARQLDCPNLEFREGDLATYVPPGPVDLAVSLHACDTATDDALAQAVRWGCEVILAVPCCQHELARALDSQALRPILRHGLLHERFATLATDALRALALEACGYTTQVVEFIELEHTPKNVLLRSVRRPVDAPQAADKRAEYEACKASLGLKSIHSDAILAAGLLNPILMNGS